MVLCWCCVASTRLRWLYLLLNYNSFASTRLSNTVFLYTEIPTSFPTPQLCPRNFQQAILHHDLAHGISGKLSNTSTLSAEIPTSNFTPWFSSRKFRQAIWQLDFGHGNSDKLSYTSTLSTEFPASFLTPQLCPRNFRQAIQHFDFGLAVMRQAFYYNCFQRFFLPKIRIIPEYALELSYES